MEKLLNAYHAALLRRDFSPNTAKRYRCVASLFFRWYMARRGWGELPAGVEAMPTDEDIRAYRDQAQRAQHRPAASINTYLMALRSFFEWVRESGRRDDNPTDPVKLLKEQRRIAPKALTGEQEEAILGAARRQRDAWRVIPPFMGRFTPTRDLCLLTLMSKAGLRASEAAGLQWGDIHEEDGEPARVEVWGKGRKQRTVPLGGVARETLKEYRAEQQDTGAQVPLFPSNQGHKAITPSTVWRRVKLYAALAGVKASPHTLRHTFGTRALREIGADLVIVGELLGHASLDTTRRYTMPTEAEKAKAVEGL